MNAPISEDEERDSKRDREGPLEITNQRGGLAERDPIGSQVDVLSPDGVRMDDDVPEVQQELTREGPAS